MSGALHSCLSSHIYIYMMCQEWRHLCTFVSATLVGIRNSNKTLMSVAWPVRFRNKCTTILLLYIYPAVIIHNYHSLNLPLGSLSIETSIKEEPIACWGKQSLWSVWIRCTISNFQPEICNWCLCNVIHLACIWRTFLAPYYMTYRRLWHWVVLVLYTFHTVMLCNWFSNSTSYHGRSSVSILH